MHLKELKQCRLITTGVKTYDYCQPNIKLVFQISKIREQLKLKVDKSNLILIIENRGIKKCYTSG